MEKSFRKSPVDENFARRWFAAQLWRAFPEARSEHDLAEMVAEVLSRDGRPITTRTVRNWLRCENAPHFRYVPMVMALAGMEAVTDLVFGEAEA